MRVLVVGGTGMLGRALVSTFGQRGYAVLAPTRSELDLGRAADVAALPSVDVVVNAAAWTNVDGAEAAEAAAFELNATGVARLARTCRLSGSRLVHVSTDYVFDGHGTTPYAEHAELAPLSAYGRSKAAGEWAARAECPDALIVRTAWLYGPGSKSFVATIAGRAAAGGTVSVVQDQRGQPSTTRDVARYVARLVEGGVPPGVYHATSEGETTWFGLAHAIFEELGLDPTRVLATTSAAFPRPAFRPAYSVLGHDRTRELGLEALPSWRQALRETLPDVIAAAPTSVSMASGPASPASRPMWTPPGSAREAPGAVGRLGGPSRRGGQG